MIKHKEEIKVTIERYPDYCAECPMFYTTEYRCHSEHGEEGHCKLGYMDRKDMRDFSGRYLFRFCHIRNDNRVILEESK